MAVHTYMEDYDGRMFGMNYPYGGQTNSSMNAYVVMNAYAPYIKSIDLFQCPGDGKFGKNIKPTDPLLGASFGWPKTMSYRYNGTYGNWRNDNDMRQKARRPLIYNAPIDDSGGRERDWWGAQSSLLFGDLRYVMRAPGGPAVGPFDFNSFPLYTQTAHSQKLLYTTSLDPWPKLCHGALYPDGHARFCKNWQRSKGADVP